MGRRRGRRGENLLVVLLLRCALLDEGGAGFSAAAAAAALGRDVLDGVGRPWAGRERSHDARQLKKLHQVGEVAAQTVPLQGAQLVDHARVDPSGGLVRETANRLEGVQQLVLLSGN